MLENHVFWRLMFFDTLLLLLLQPSVLCFSVVVLNSYAKPLPKCILREFDLSRIQPRLDGLPHVKTFTWQNVTPADPRLEGSPRLSCKRGHSKMRDYMDRRVTAPKWAISPTWSPLLPCKQAPSIRPSFRPGE